MKTKTLLSIAIIAALPFVANAGNIQGDMYVAPQPADTNHPVPTTNASFPYGRVNIDTTDQEHIATTAYVKGAYNSAIAAVNKTTEDVYGYVNDGLDGVQDRLRKFNEIDDGINSELLDVYTFSDYANTSFTDDGGIDMSERLVTADGIAAGIQTYVGGRGVEIYTTWNDNDTTTVGFVPLD